MLIQPEQTTPRELYQVMTRLITPRPIAWVSTRSLAGVDNLAPFSYFNAVGTSPPTVMFCPANRADGSKKDTLRNVEESGQFVLNLVSAKLAEPMNCSSGDYSSSESEFDRCGLTRTESTRVKPPRVGEALAAIECELHTVLLLGTGPGGSNMVIGRIVAMHVDDSCFDSAGQIDTDRIDPLGRMGGSAYALTRERFDLARPKV